MKRAISSRSTTTSWPTTTVPTRSRTVPDEFEGLLRNRLCAGQVRVCFQNAHVENIQW